MKTVKVYTPCAPAHGAARKWVRNRNVWVIVFQAENGFANINSRSIVEKICIARGVDSRYEGEKSAYGQAIRKAEELAERMKIKWGE